MAFPVEGFLIIHAINDGEFPEKRQVTGKAGFRR